MPAKSVTGLSPIGSATKFRCFCEVVLIMKIDGLGLEKKADHRGSFWIRNKNRRTSYLEEKSFRIKKVTVMKSMTSLETGGAKSTEF